MSERRGLIASLKAILDGPTQCQKCGATLCWSEEIPLDFFMPFHAMTYKETRWYQLYGCPNPRHKTYGRRRTRISHDGPHEE